MENWTPLDWARFYYDQGLCVIPSKDGKPQLDSWTQYQLQRPEWEQVQTWFRGETFRSLQIYIVCGRVSNVVVVDCDSNEAEQFWRELIGDELLDTTACGLSGGGRGHHYWFRLGERDQEGRASHRGDIQWDLRAEGGGVVVPPSPHRSGGRYQWIRELDVIQPWPYPEIPGKGTSSHEGGEHSSSLAWLLQNPGDGGRNNWVTAVLGHYAKRLDFEDGYRATAEMVWMLALDIPADHPYERDEFDATVQSVWATEKRKVDITDDVPTETTGFLVSNGDSIYCLCNNKEEGTTLKRFSEFDFRAKSIITMADESSAYVVDVTASLSGQTDLFEMVIPGEYFGSSDRLNRFLASRRLTTSVPAGDIGLRMPKGTRIQKYLESQEPVRFESSPWMGWYKDRYVIEEGVITSSGLTLRGNARIIPDPRINRGGSSWRYGFDDPDMARAVLREIMTFHDPVTTSLFGSIWALAPIKGAIMQVSSLFPHMAIIAPSEAGKTNGFFDLALQANGRLSVGGTYTAASLRDDLARHRGGFCWIDDPANIDDLGDLLRSAAGEGVHSRKGGANWSETIHTNLVAPVVLSAEGLAMLRERAMADRVIEFDVPSPVGRQSRYGEYRQWDDVTRMMTTVGHLSRFAGNYVQMALQWLESIGGQPGLHQMLLTLRRGEGRMAEKVAFMRTGARALAWMLGEWQPLDVDGYTAGAGDPVEVVALVDDWVVGAVANARRGPYLTSVIMPSYIADKGYIPSFKSVPHEPLFMDGDGLLRINVSALAAWWQGYVRNRTDKARALQLGDVAALKTEARQFEWDSSPIKKKRYLKVDRETTRQVMLDCEFDPDDVSDHLELDT